MHIFKPKSYLFMAELISSVDDLIMYLQSICPLPFSEGLVEHLRKVVKSRVIPRNDFLLAEGDVSRDIYFISEGLLYCYYLKEDGTRVTSWLLKEGDVVVSIPSFYDQVISIENIQAIEETKAFYISYEELWGLYLKSHEFGLVGIILTVKYLKFWNLQLYNLRMRTLRERYELLVQGSDSDLLNRVPQKILASYLDMLPETFSRKKNNS